VSVGTVHLKKSAYTSNTVFTFLLKMCSHNRQEMSKCYLLICKPWPFIHQDSRHRFTKLKQVEHFVKENFPPSEKVHELPQIHTEHLHIEAVVFTLSVWTWIANPDFCHYKLADFRFQY